MQRKRIRVLQRERTGSGSLLTAAGAPAASGGKTAPNLPGGMERGSMKSFKALRALLSSQESRIVAALKGRGRAQELTMQRSYNKMGGQTLRIFLSSTFRDMNGERDTFVQKYLPALRQHCTELGLFLSIIDLRWGVTVEQAQSGEVVPICMSEVEHSDYFVCFLGARYGWAPRRNDIPPFAYESFKFLQSYIPSRSVTECEIIYGALGWGPDTVCAPKRAFFFIRDDEYLDTLPAEEADAYLEKDAFGTKNLRRLKQRVRDRCARARSSMRVRPAACATAHVRGLMRLIALFLLSRCLPPSQVQGVSGERWRIRLRRMLAPCLVVARVRDAS